MRSAFRQGSGFSTQESEGQESGFRLEIGVDRWERTRNPRSENEAVTPVLQGRLIVDPARLNGLKGCLTSFLGRLTKKYALLTLTLLVSPC